MATHLRVDYDREEYFEREPNPNDEWDSGCSVADITINGMRVAEEETYCDITVDFDVVRDRDYYLLWADYSSGDSFGSYDNQVELIDVFETHEAAKAARWSLLEIGNVYTGTYKRENGKIVSFCLPWVGYFEGLNELNVEIIRVI